MEGLLANKTIVVMGVANRRSIAWGCAQEMEKQGATVIYTYNRERTLKRMTKLVGEEKADRMIQCDVASDESIQRAFQQIGEQFGQLDGVVHSVAFANPAELGNDRRFTRGLRPGPRRFGLLLNRRLPGRSPVAKEPS